MYNQSCGYQGMNARPCGCGSAPVQGGCSCHHMPHMGGCAMNNATSMGGCTANGCPRPQPIVAPKKVCVTNQVTPVPQPVICPIECRRVNHCMYYPVYYPQYEQTFVTQPFNQSC